MKTNTTTSKIIADKNVTNTNKKVAAKAANNQVFCKLDPTQFQRRIEQRRRAIQHGKNTAGYDEYIKEVPKNQRRPRSMKHPSTPDHTLEIPTKRWQGLIKAWYVVNWKVPLDLSLLSYFLLVSNLSSDPDSQNTQNNLPFFSRRKALHQYDPPDLAMAFAEEATPQEEKQDIKTVKGLELAQAHQQGLLVDLGRMEESPTSVACRSDKLLDQWEAKRDDLEDAILDDSDDELL